MNYTIFDMLYKKYKPKNKIRLLEFFSGYGSQALALKHLGVDFEHWKTCEWAIKSIQAYKDIHFIDKTYDSKLTKDEYVDYLFKKGISSNYNEPMTYEQIKRMNEKQLKIIYDNIQVTNNLVNIQQVKGKDLEIVDTDKYDYILTYSFPCQDLSLAGKGKGMKDTSTRSGMLWEVERILKECKELGNLPQVLLMENVPQIHSEDNLKDFYKWQETLDNLGYTSYVKDLIATDYGIPQTRNRCFMVSVLGNYNYTFPKSILLRLKLKDLLEDNVNEKYFLSDKVTKKILSVYSGNKDSIGIDLNDSNSKGRELCSTIKSRYDCGYEHFTPGPTGIIVGTYQYGKSDNFMKGKNRFNLGKNISDTLQTTQKEGIIVIGNYSKSNHNASRIVECNNIYDLFFTIFNLCCIINTEEKDKYERSRELLQILWQEIGKKEIWQEIRRFVGIQEKKILQQGMYEKSILENWKQQPKISTSTPNSCEYNEEFSNREKMFNMWEEWKIRYTPQRWELSKQQFREFNLFMQELSYETTSKEESMCNMWKTNERFRILRETLSKIQEIWKPTDNKIQNGLRIRKLTPREVFRLMGVKDKDYEKVKKNQSDSSLYHLAGDSIVVNVLMAIFGELFRINWEEKFNPKEWWNNDNNKK